MNQNHYQNYYFLRESQNYSPMNWNSFSNSSLFPPQEGFMRGNLFQNLYDSYKNYQPAKLEAKTNQEKQLQNIQSICFAMHDLNLYLDVHPSDQSMVTLFQDYRRKLDSLIQEYESQYGPLTVNSETMMGDGYSWIRSPWPWEVDNV